MTLNKIVYFNQVINTHELNLHGEKQMWWAKLKTNCNLMRFKPFLPILSRLGEKTGCDRKKLSWKWSWETEASVPSFIRTSLCTSLWLRKWLRWLGLTQEVFTYLLPTLIQGSLSRRKTLIPHVCAMWVTPSCPVTRHTAHFSQIMCLTCVTAHFSQIMCLTVLSRLALQNHVLNQRIHSVREEMTIHSPPQGWPQLFGTQ